jgi:hypothetical protein
MCHLPIKMRPTYNCFNQKTRKEVLPCDLPGQKKFEVSALVLGYLASSGPSWNSSSGAQLPYWNKSRLCIEATCKCSG